MRKLVLLTCLTIVFSIFFIHREVQSQAIADSCPAQIWWSEVEPSVIAFLDAAEIAGATSRVALSPVLIEVRRAQRAFEAIGTPDCLIVQRNMISSGMNDVVFGFLAFASDSDGEYVDERIDVFTSGNMAFYDVATDLDNAGVILLPASTRLLTGHYLWGGLRGNISAIPTRTATATATITPTQTPRPPTRTPFPTITPYPACTSSQLRSSVHWMNLSADLIDGVTSLAPASEVERLIALVNNQPRSDCFAQLENLVLQMANSYLSALESTDATQRTMHLQLMRDALQAFEAEFNRISSAN